MGGSEVRTRRRNAAFHAMGAVATGVVLWLAAPVGDWHPLWLALALVALAPLTELFAVRQHVSPRVSLSDLTIIPAMVLLGPLAAAAASFAATVADSTRAAPRSAWPSSLSNAWIQVLWPVVGSLTFFALVDESLDPASPIFLATTAGAAALGIVLNLCLVLADVHLDPRGLPVQPGYAAHAVALVSAPVLVASIGIVAAYGLGGGYAAILVIVALLLLRHLIDQLLLLLARERELEARNEELSTFHLGVLGLLTATLAQRDRLTARHSAAVSRWAGDLARASECDPEAEWTIRTAGLLHDIGKFVLPDALLYQDGNLSELQREQVRTHADEGAALVGRVAGLAAVAALIRHHHERFDGGGYPDGLAREEIPLGSRILAVCEAYDAMTARDSYRAPVAPSEALERLRGGAGAAFDPILVERFASLLEKEEPLYRHGEAADFQSELDDILADEHSSAPEVTVGR